MKNIAIIGGTGSTGRELVRLALGANYIVTLVVRNPNNVHPENNLTILKGDVTHLESLKKAFRGMDVVISCFGPSSGRKPGKIMSVGTANMVQACEQCGVKRFVFMSGILQTDGRELSFFNRLGLQMIRLFYKQVYKDKQVAETTIQKSALDWVIVRAVGLSTSKPGGKYKAGIQMTVSPFDPLSYTDFALCLLHAIEEDRWTRKILHVGKS